MRFRFHNSTVSCRMILSALLLFLVLLSGGCKEPRKVALGEKPPEISGADITGEYITLDSFKGKVVVLYFWKSSCCGEKLKLLEPYFRSNNDKGVALCAINVGDSRGMVESYVQSGGLTFSVQADEHSMTAKEYGVFGYPTIFILDRSGVLRKKILGEIDFRQLEQQVEQLQ
jgi:peroxiredoxin